MFQQSSIIRLVTSLHPQQSAVYSISLRCLSDHTCQTQSHTALGTLGLFFFRREFLPFAGWRRTVAARSHRSTAKGHATSFTRVYLTRYYMQVSALETQKSIHFQTNPSPPPSCCIQVDIWPVISPSVEETCGHLMTPTGVTHAIALDGAMTVCFNISLYMGKWEGFFFPCFLRSAKGFKCKFIFEATCLESRLVLCKSASLGWLLLLQMIRSPPESFYWMVNQEKMLVSLAVFIFITLCRCGVTWKSDLNRKSSRVSPIKGKVWPIALVALM